MYYKYCNEFKFVFKDKIYLVSSLFVFLRVVGK